VNKVQNRTAQVIEPRKKRLPRSNKKKSEERKKERKNGVGAQTMIMAKQTEVNRSKQNQTEPNRSKQNTIKSKNNNQPNRNGGNLQRGGWRQPLNVAADPPNPPWSIFEVAEVVENRKVSF
jgi:hypothetical protein